MKTRFNAEIARLALCVSISAVIAACGGGGGSSAGTSTTSSINAVGGTVAIGSALPNVTVTIRDATGKTVATTSSQSGSYATDTSGLTPPFIVSATDPSGTVLMMYSVVSAPATSPANGTVTANVTPLTTAVAALMTDSGNPADLLDNMHVAVTTQAIHNAITKLDGAIAPILTANGLEVNSFDPIGNVFATNQTGHDAVIDSVAVRPSATGTGLQITSVADPNTAIQLNSGTSISTALAVPPQSANYLATLQSQLSQCMLDKQNDNNANTTSCNQAIDPAYLQNGMMFGQEHEDIYREGSRLFAIKTLAFLPVGTLPKVTKPAALVNLLFTHADGTVDFASDVVQQKADGTWDIIGMQTDYQVMIGTFLGRVQSTKDGSGRYEAGLQIDIPSHNLTATLASAVVKGPGLPANGLVLTVNGYQSTGDVSGPHASSQEANTYLAIGDGQSSVSATSQYKLVWNAFDGSALSNPSTPDYSPSPVDLSVLPQFASYTVDLYVQEGAHLPQQTVLNIAPFVNTRQAKQVAWLTLGSNTIADFLTPGGALAVHATDALNVDFQTADGNDGYANVWTGVSVIQALPDGTNPGMTYAYRTRQNEAFHDAGVVTKSQPAVTWLLCGTSAYCSGSTLEGLSAEASRSVILGWQKSGVFYTNTYQYQN